MPAAEPVGVARSSCWRRAERSGATDAVAQRRRRRRPARRRHNGAVDKFTSASSLIITAIGNAASSTCRARSARSLQVLDRRKASDLGDGRVRRSSRWRGRLRAGGQIPAVEVTYLGRRQVRTPNRRSRSDRSLIASRPSRR
jgi:hypothetical protein